MDSKPTDQELADHLLAALVTIDEGASLCAKHNWPVTVTITDGVIQITMVRLGMLYTYERPFEGSLTLTVGAMLQDIEQALMYWAVGKEPPKPITKTPVPLPGLVRREKW